MAIKTENKEEKNYQNFMNELEKISKKYGIGLMGCGCFRYWDEDGFQKISYTRDSSSGDLMIEELVFSDGTDFE